MAFDDKVVMNEYKREILKLRQKDLHNTAFEEFRKNHEWVAQQFDNKINSFYDDRVESVNREIKLPKAINDEIIYFNFLSEKFTETDLVNGINNVYQKFISFDSPFQTYVENFRWKLKEASDLLENNWFTEFFKNWNFMLTKRIIDYRLKTVEDLRYNYLVEVYSLIKNYSRYTKIYKTMYDVFGYVANVKDELKNLNIDAIIRFSEFMYKDPSILKIAELLGRLNGEDDKMEINITEEITHYETEVMLPYNPEEIVGITESKNLERVLPFEMAYLFNQKLQPIFYKKFAESKLQSFLFNSKEKIIEPTVEEVEYEAPIPLERGPFLLCIDTSSSMEGSGEYIAKALAIAIIKISLKEHRRVIVINFASSDVEEYEIKSEDFSIINFTKFLAKSFYGTTNAKPAFVRAIEKMKKEEYKRADLMMISDFMMSDWSNDLLKSVQELKQNYNRFHSLIVGTMPNIITQQLFDNVMYYDPNDPNATQQIIKSLNETLRNLHQLTDEELSHQNKETEKLNVIRNKKRTRAHVDSNKLSKKELSRILKTEEAKLKKDNE
ncbi:VWA domain-containing protein [Spiroplasma endosymbiont of Labia minor]|uniref:VWA domain-containing protein n=1 Tax=Spiroplasma endosymbiont of Labia minor TaxID=3066305 RepID=UPI0030D18215